MMRLATRLLAATLLVTATAPARADVICEWMAFADKTLPSGPPAVAGVTQVRTGEGDHAETKVALAMFEAVNAIDRRYRSYVGLAPGSATADQQAAAISAAREVMAAQKGVSLADLDASADLALSGIADGRAKADGIALGKAAAAAVLKIADLTDARTLAPYRPATVPGQWVPTALPFGSSQMPAHRPWVLRNAEELRPPPPPALTSERYARDFNEVKRMGALSSTARTPVETLMARYRITSDEMPAMRTLADQQGRRLVDNARLFALYKMMGDDLGITMVEAKNHYAFWRPITAIRNADRDNNPATEVDPGWLPLMQTPNHGEYPCGHCTYAGAVAGLMSELGGERPAWGVRISSGSIPNAAVQVLPDWNEWVRQVSYSRTLGGVHYRFSNEAGEAMGRKLARLTLERALQPLPAAEARPAQ